MLNRISWQEVVLILGMCAALILSGIFAPGVVTTMGGVIATLIGWFVGAVRATPQQPDIPEPTPTQKSPTTPTKPSGGAQ